MIEGVRTMIYSTALFVGTSVLCYSEPLRATEKALLVISGLIIGWFWTVEVLKQNHRENHKHKRNNRRK